MTRRSLIFEVPGDPVPKARARVANGHAFTPERTRTYERTVQAYALQARQHHAVHVGPWETSRRYAVRLTLYPGTRRRSDIDNTAKALLDASNGVLWDDDSQIDRLDVVRVWGDERPRAVVSVEQMDEPTPVPSKRPAARHPWRSKAVTPKVSP